MALSAGQVWSGGYVRDADGRRVVVLENVVAPQKPLSSGQIRDVDGRPVVVLRNAVVN